MSFCERCQENHYSKEKLKFCAWRLANPPKKRGTYRDPVKIKRRQKMRAKGMNLREIAEKEGVSHQAVSSFLRYVSKK